jgi:hypothetical protein
MQQSAIGSQIHKHLMPDADTDFLTADKGEDHGYRN